MEQEQENNDIHKRNKGSLPMLCKLTSNDSNYEQWKDDMTAWLKKARVWQIVNGNRTMPISSSPPTSDQLAEIQAYEHDTDKVAGELLLWIEEGQKVYVKDMRDKPCEICDYSHYAVQP
jgi:hypothetical protein